MKMNRRAARIAIGLALIAALFGGWRFYYMGSPEYSLGQMRAAMADGKRLRFERYVDVPALADQAIEAVIGRVLMESVASSSSGFGILGASLGAGVVKQMQPALTAALRNSILKSVESGHLDSVFAVTESTDEGGRNINLALVGRAAAVDLSQFRGTTEIEREGDVATIGFRFRSEPLDTTLVLRARLERSDRRWRVTGFDNLDSYLAEVSELQELKLDEVNMRNRKVLDYIVKAGEPRRRMRGRSYNQYLEVRVPVTNLSNDTITTVLVFLTGLEGTKQNQALVLENPPLPPGKTENVWTIVDYNRFIDWHTQLRFSESLAPEIWFVTQETGGEEYSEQMYITWEEYLSDVWSQ